MPHDREKLEPEGTKREIDEILRRADLLPPH
jgi:hypothetical protein